MTTFKQFINENTSTLLSVDSFDHAAFLRDCDFFLRHSEGNPMWHGSKRMRNLIGDAGILPFVQRSEPKDTSIEHHQIMNKFFKSEFGVEARNWMFATGSGRVARQYGDVYRIFPIGEFQWLSIIDPEGADLYALCDNIAHDVSKAAGYHGDPAEAPDDMLDHIADEITEHLNRFDYSFNDDLRDCLRSPNEIMMKCSNFYAIKDAKILQLIDGYRS